MQKAWRKNELTDFGFWMKLRLLEQRRTQADLAREIGTTRQVISRIIYGDIPGKKHVPKIIAILGGGYPAEKI